MITGAAAGLDTPDLRYIEVLPALLGAGRVHGREVLSVRAFSGKVAAGFPQEMRPLLKR
jgi:hypothetical protein